jgi:hypothetical protein
MWVDPQPDSQIGNLPIHNMHAVPFYYRTAYSLHFFDCICMCSIVKYGKLDFSPEVVSKTCNQQQKMTNQHPCTECGRKKKHGGICEFVFLFQKFPKYTHKQDVTHNSRYLYPKTAVIIFYDTPISQSVWD